MNAIEEFRSKMKHIEQLLGYPFKNRDLLLLAFTHRSFINENRDLTETHNERLEFLGDSVLGLLIAEHLYRSQPENTEGDLSHLRSRLVQAGTCASYVRKLGLDAYLLVGRGEKMGDGRGKESMAADLFEAIIGAIFLDGGLDKARRFLMTHFDSDIEATLEAPERNYKAELQDYAQRLYQLTPNYQVVTESGPDHSKSFVVSVTVKENVLGTGCGCSKKEASQAAAADALTRIDHG